jgi:hypothetical protein
LKYFHLAYLSKPKSQRILYRQIRRLRPVQIVELGLGDVTRALSMIQVAQRYAEDRPVQYTGIDLFEMRAAGQPNLRLKDAHRQLQSTGARVRLIPGDPLAALSQAANSLTGTDLLIFSADQDPAALQSAWFYVPRMLHPTSLVLQEHSDSTGQPVLQVIPHDQIQQWANSRSPLRRAA